MQKARKNKFDENIEENSISIIPEFTQKISREKIYKIADHSSIDLQYPPNKRRRQ